MDDPTLAGLEAALLASPDNLPLAALLLREYVARGRGEDALRLYAGKEPASLADRPLLARAALLAGDPERALDVLSGEEPETLLLRARALLALGRKAEGEEAYAAAIARNPTLEDRDLRASLGAREREVANDGPGPRLRVIANDDTDESELGRLLAPPEKPVRFSDVGGLESIKEQVRRKIILPFQKPSLFERFKKRAGGGILLYGPPGCGKTLLARATAGECNARFYNVAISDILDMYIGESERKLHALFEKARTSLPAVLFFDELEALAGKRQFSREATASKLVSQFLSEMDGFAQNNSGVLILGATNVPWAIDPAFRRPGRFDRVLFVPPPDEAARSSILSLLLDGRPVSPDIDVQALAKKTSGYTGADLQNLVETASDEAIQSSLAGGSEVPISQTHLRASLTQVKTTATEWLSTARNHARYANESGQYDEVLAFLERHGKS